VRTALMGGFASSRILEVHGERMVKRNFEPGFRIELHQKDLNLALQGARAMGISLPNTATTQGTTVTAAADGFPTVIGELTVKAHLMGMRVAEVPTTWRDRTAGQSRFQLWQWLPRYMRWYWRGIGGRFGASK